MIIFTGLSRFVLSKKFPGKEGRTISTGIAVILSVAMTVFSYTTGFRLGNLAPLAAVILLILVAATLFIFIKHIGGNTATASMAALIVTYFLTRATFPELYAWAQNNQFAAWIDSAILMAIPVLAVMLFMKAKGHFPGSRDILAGIDKPAKGFPQTDPKLTPDEPKPNGPPDKSAPTPPDTKQREVLAEQSTQQEKQAAKTEKFVSRDLKAIIDILKTKGITPQTKPAIRDVLADLQRQDTELSRSLNQLKLIYHKLETWDIAGFKQLSQTYQQLSPDNQRLLKEAIQVQRQSLLTNQAIQILEKRVDQYHQDFQRTLNLAMNELGHNDTRQAINYLLQAQKLQDASQGQLGKIRSLQKQLLRLTRGEVEIMKKLAA